MIILNLIADFIPPLCAIVLPLLAVLDPLRLIAGSRATQVCSGPCHISPIWSAGPHSRQCARNWPTGRATTNSQELGGRTACPRISRARTTRPDSHSTGSPARWFNVHKVAYSALRRTTARGNSIRTHWTATSPRPSTSRRKAPPRRSR